MLYSTENAYYGLTLQLVLATHHCEFKKNVQHGYLIEGVRVELEVPYAASVGYELETI
jgi:hypothetical protein